MRRALLVCPVLLFSLHAQDAALEHAREVNLERAAKLPNFVADETAKRYSSRPGASPKWEYEDTIESEIAFKGNQVTRQRMVRNGKPWNKSFVELPGIHWGFPFGTELKPLFDPKCPTRMDFEDREEEHGKQLLVYRFTSPPNSCFDTFTSGRTRLLVIPTSKDYNPARTGRIFIDDPEGNLIHFEEDAKDFPKGFGLDWSKKVVFWDFAKIGDTSYLLPSAVDFVFGSSTGSARVTVEYKNHRHFEASTSLTFK